MDPELKHLVKKQKEQIKYLLFLCTVMGLLVLILSFYWLSGEIQVAKATTVELLKAITANSIPILLFSAASYLLFSGVFDGQEAYKIMNIATEVSKKVNARLLFGVREREDPQRRPRTTRNPRKGIYFSTTTNTSPNLASPESYSLDENDDNGALERGDDYEEE